jgi:hypothetical protein
LRIPSGSGKQFVEQVVQRCIFGGNRIVWGFVGGSWLAENQHLLADKIFW